MRAFACCLAHALSPPLLHCDACVTAKWWHLWAGWDGAIWQAVTLGKLLSCSSWHQPKGKCAEEEVDTALRDSYVHMNNNENKEHYIYDSFLHACYVSEFQEIKPHFKKNIYSRLGGAELLIANLWQSQDLSLLLSWIHPQISICPTPRPLCPNTTLSV